MSGLLYSSLADQQSCWEGESAFQYLGIFTTGIHADSDSPYQGIQFYSALAEVIDSLSYNGQAHAEAGQNWSVCDNFTMISIISGINFL